MRLDSWECLPSFAESVLAFVPRVLDAFCITPFNQRQNVLSSVTFVPTSWRRINLARKNARSRPIEGGHRLKPRPRVVAFQQRSKHTTLYHSFLVPSQLLPTSRARLQREPVRCTIVLTRCFVTHGAQFRVEPLLKFCSMSEVHAGLICSTAECTAWICWRRRGGKGVEREDKGGKDGVPQ